MLPLNNDCDITIVALKAAPTPPYPVELLSSNVQLCKYMVTPWFIKRDPPKHSRLLQAVA